MNNQSSNFEKVFSAWDILVIAFGAMIGWGWVVSTGDWIGSGGVLGAMLGFALGGIMIYFIGLTYAELTSAMPACGGEHVFSFRAMGPIGSFICTWAIILGYVGVVCFEACALPTIVTYLYPQFLQGYLYTVAGFDIYASWLATAIAAAIAITAINLMGAKTAAFLQTVLTVIIGGAGILLIVASLFSGSTANLAGQTFVGEHTGDVFSHIIKVAMVSPFYFIGFDVIPQAAEEINVPLKKIGRMLLLSIVMAISFYVLVIFAVGLVMNKAAIADSYNSTGLVTADAMARAFHSSVMAKVLIVGGLCGIMTSWNSFLIGGSRALYSMAQSYMVPPIFGKLGKKHKTPVAALLLIGAISIGAVFLGRKMLVWVADAGNFACCLAYCMVAISFVILRTKEPDMQRPYKVKHGKLVGALAILMSGAMVLLYMIPGSGATLAPVEWGMIGGWALLGAAFFAVCKLKYREKFGTVTFAAAEEETPQKEITGVPEGALAGATDAVAAAAKAPAAGQAQPALAMAARGSFAKGRTAAGKPLVAHMFERRMPETTMAMDFDFFAPAHIVFGCGKADETGAIAGQYGRRALIVTGHSSAKKSGLYDRVRQSLEAAGLTTCLYDKVTPNPLTTTAEEGAALAIERGCDVVVGIGGGSIMDAAKGIAFAAVNKGPISDYIYGIKSSDKALPLVLIPTTCGTGSEGNGFAVLTNPANGDKKSLRCAAIMPKAAIVDPTCMMTMPKRALAAVGFDALCHCIEAYTAKRATPFTDALCLYAIPLLIDNLPDLVNGRESRAAWEKVSIASTIGGMVIGAAGVTLAHAMEHPVSGLKNAVHGEGLAAITPLTLEVNYGGNRYKYGRLARMLGGYTAEDCAPKIRSFLKAIHLEVRLGDLGITERDIDWLADNCLKVSMANLQNNPVPLTREDIAAFYGELLQDEAAGEDAQSA